ncbi:MAG: acyl-CoA dehydrogenase [Gammaproteobacteria bacterium]|nr:acyl-CoA dehydrogenase [Gammaproteobacteria bacterium]
MSSYTAPLQDMQFVIDELCNVSAKLGELPAFAELGVGSELSAALLGESAKLCSGVVAPLRRVGDTQPATCQDGQVTLAPGYADALQQLAQGGWFGIAADPDYGGQGLPEIYGTAACEMWNAADMAFALAPILSIGAATAISAHGTEQQKTAYLEKMHTGEWSGSMNLTESGAGSDLGVMTSRAVPEGDHYRLYGQKIFITWGDHDATDNIIHLVLAKLPDAPAGSRGISLFIVPKFLLNTDGSPGERNDVWPVSVEHKLGIHGSPTCVMAFGEKEGAIGYLLGEENQGLACMFTMMNEARLKIGVQGLGVSEGAYQKALAYARERVQGGVPIIEHADVKRMLLTMKTSIEAMRALAYSEAVTLDRAHHLKDPAEQARIDLMIPVIKGWLTEMGDEITSLGVQVHGGMGFIEETGAAQYFRDARIAPIYEGTNGIQAVDLVSRKLGRDGGASMESLLADVQATIEQCGAGTTDIQAIGTALAAARQDLQASTGAILGQLSDRSEAAQAGAYDYMMQVGYVVGGWHMARSALLAQARRAESDDPFYPRKIRSACYYSEHILPRAQSHGAVVESGSSALLDFDSEWM